MAPLAPLAFAFAAREGRPPGVRARGQRPCLQGGLPHEEVVEAIVAGRGSQFDPDMVDAFLRVREAWRRIAIEFADEHDEAPAPDGGTGSDRRKGSGVC